MNSRHADYDWLRTGWTELRYDVNTLILLIFIVFLMDRDSSEFLPVGCQLVASFVYSVTESRHYGHYQNHQTRC